MAAESIDLALMVGLRFAPLRAPDPLEHLFGDRHEVILDVGMESLIRQAPGLIIELFPSVPMDKAVCANLHLTDRDELSLILGRLEPIAVSVDSCIWEVVVGEGTRTLIQPPVVLGDSTLMRLIHQYRNIGLPSTWRILGWYSSTS
jgi:hypothetical protein